MKKSKKRFLEKVKDFTKFVSVFKNLFERVLRVGSMEKDDSGVEFFEAKCFCNTGLYIDILELKYLSVEVVNC